MESLASILKDNIMELVGNINKNPELVMNLGKLVAKSKFDWSFMAAIICGLKNKLLMDKAIQVMVDTWNEYVSKKDDICYVIDGYFPMYDVNERGLYSTQAPMKRLKYLILERDLKAVRDGELERRKVDADFKKMVSSMDEEDEEQKFTYTEDTFKKSAMITDMQLTLVLAKLIVSGWMPKTSSLSDFLKLFSGVKSKFFLTWTGKPTDLHDFFDMLTRKKVVSGKKKEPGYITPRGKYLNIVCSHFKDPKGKWFGELNHKRHNESNKDVLTMLEICLTYSLDDCIKMMKKITIEYKDLFEDIDLSVKPKHTSNYGRVKKSVK